MKSKPACTDAVKEKPAVDQQQLVRLRELATQLPTDLRADWDGTNHFELCSMTASDDPNHEYWWLIMGDYFRRADGTYDGSPCDSVEGKRLGLLMDIAEEVARLRDEGSI